MRTLKARDTYQLGTRGQFLWGHEQGVQVRIDIERKLEGLGAAGVLIIDFKNVQVVDVSFASEVFGKLYGRLDTEYPGRVVLLSGMSEYVRVNLDAALERMGLMALAIGGSREWELIGKVADTDIETLSAVCRLGEVTAPAIASALGIKLTTCNQRLRKLTESGSISRMRVTAPTGGDQYLYACPL